jgi:hypothetical protein
MLTHRVECLRNDAGMKARYPVGWEMYRPARVETSELFAIELAVFQMHPDRVHKMGRV